MKSISVSIWDNGGDRSQNSTIYFRFGILVNGDMVLFCRSGLKDEK